MSLSIQPDISIILPLYREEPHLKDCVTELLGLLQLTKLEFELIFVEDFSPDNTRVLAQSLVADLSRRGITARLILQPQNFGRGRAVKDGLRAAKARVSAFMDVDLENQPEAFLPMYQMVAQKDFDLVVGTRVKTNRRLKPIRRICHLAYRFLSQLVLPLPVPDTETGLKVFRTAKVVPILDSTPNDGWFWDTEIVLESHRAGLKVGQHPVVYVRRNGKESTVRIVRDALVYLQALICKSWEIRKKVDRKWITNHTTKTP